MLKDLLFSDVKFLSIKNTGLNQKIQLDQMRLFFFILLFLFPRTCFSDLTFYVDQAHKNNPKLNAERKTQSY